VQLYWCRSESIDNSRQGTLRFALSEGVTPACVHGFAGYFEAVLYKKVLLSTVPVTHTPDMHSWFPLFFPLRAPAVVYAGEEVVVGMWRVVHGSKVRPRLPLAPLPLFLPLRWEAAREGTVPSGSASYLT
jgi:type II protein arginine methyltransferase